MAVDKELEQFLIEGKEITKELFDVEINTSIDYVTDRDVAGVYDFITDSAFVYKKFVDYLFNQAKKVDRKTLFYHLVCHETGHALDSRKCEEKNFFPYIIRVSNTSVMKIANCYELKTQPLQQYLSYFINSLFDYSVDKRIVERIGMFDQTAKIRVDKPSLYLKNSKEADERQRRIIELTFDLPTYLHDFYFGDIDNGKREILKECSIKYLSKQLWESVLGIFENQGVVEASNFYTIIPEVFKILFDLKADWRLEKRQRITEKLPAFWCKEGYNVLYIE
jgi:hypothetical protein